MAGISFKDLGKNNSKKSTPSTENKKNLFKNFSNEKIKRDDQLNSTLLKLSEIEEFEENVRIQYDEDELNRLSESIKEGGFKKGEEIRVVHIKKGDRYIISDGHRRYRATLKALGKDYKLEVFVVGEYPELTKDVKLSLVTTGFVTSNLKQNLNIFEELNGVAKILSYLDDENPNNAPHKISSKAVYDKLGFSKTKAWNLGKVIDNIPQVMWNTLNKANVSANILKELSLITDEDILLNALKIAQKGNIESKEDVKEIRKINKIVEESVPDEIQDKKEAVEKIVSEKFDEQKKEKKKKKKILRLEDDFNFEKDGNFLRNFAKGVDLINIALIDKKEMSFGKKQEKQFQIIFNRLNNIIKND